MPYHPIDDGFEVAGRASTLDGAQQFVRPDILKRQTGSVWIASHWAATRILVSVSGRRVQTGGGVRVVVGGAGLSVERCPGLIDEGVRVAVVPGA